MVHFVLSVFPYKIVKKSGELRVSRSIGCFHWLKLEKQSFLSFFLLILARSNFDHYARECNFGILKKKQKQNKKN